MIKLDIAKRKILFKSKSHTQKCTYITFGKFKLFIQENLTCIYAEALYYILYIISSIESFFFSLPSYILPALNLWLSLYTVFLGNHGEFLSNILTCDTISWSWLIHVSFLSMANLPEYFFIAERFKTTIQWIYLLHF